MENLVLNYQMRFTNEPTNQKRQPPLYKFVDTCSDLRHLDLQPEMFLENVEMNMLEQVKQLHHQDFQDQGLREGKYLYLFLFL